MTAPAVVVIAGARRGVGTSTLAALLALALAERGERARLVAADANAMGAELAQALAGASPDEVLLVDAGATLAAARGALRAGGPAARLLAVAAPDPVALAGAHALLKALAPHAAALALVGGDADAAARAHAHLERGAAMFLDAALPLAGHFPDDPCLALALAAGMSVQDAAAGGPCATAAAALAGELLHLLSPSGRTARGASAILA